MVKVTIGANEEVRSLLTESLELEDSRIFASDGSDICSDAINVVGREKPGLILLDLNIPILVSNQFTNEGHRMPGISDRKILLPFRLMHAKKSMQERADHFIFKPILPDELTPKYKRIIIKEKKNGEKT